MVDLCLWKEGSFESVHGLAMSADDDHRLEMLCFEVLMTDDWWWKLFFLVFWCLQKPSALEESRLDGICNGLDGWDVV